MAGTKPLELAQALYPFTGSDQAVPLTFAESAILLIAERTPDGWCRGFSTGREGWFPASYVKPLSNDELAQVSTATVQQFLYATANQKG